MRSKAWCLAAIALAGCGRDAGMLHAASEPGTLIAALGWWLLAVSAAVIVVVSVLLVIAMRRATTAQRAATKDSPIDPGADRRSARAISSGVIATVLILAATFIMTIVVLGRTMHPATTPSLTVVVTAHQWWWEVRYQAPSFVTANEVHIPVGRPVRVLLRSADVIHSFWVPALGGKTDLEPGRTIETWIRADRAGRYAGLCGEYCGAQHAHMGFDVIADDDAAFDAWITNESRPAADTTGVLIAEGREAFMRTCAACHAIRGTAAAGSLGPDLTHVAARATLAAGTLANTPGDLAGWISDPPSLKPGTLMPRLPLASEELVRLVAYMRSLR